MTDADVIVIGGGIAGSSAAAELALDRNVILLEMEDRPGYHTSGRSAAVYEPNYGPVPVLALTRASYEFLKSPPAGFADAPILTPRPVMMIEPEGQEEDMRKILEVSLVMNEITFAEAQRHLPILREGFARRIFLDTHCSDIDVDLLHRGFLKVLKGRGGSTVMNAEVMEAERAHGTWQLKTKAGQFSAPVIVNASGAWGDVVAKRCGVTPIGLTPKRRSIGVTPVEAHSNLMNWPMINDARETFYAKPQSGKLLVSSADRTPVEPHDAYADDMAIAEGVERLMAATTLEVSRLDHSWGGLRTFCGDGDPAVGFDPHTEGFFWLVGQGGYGIMTSPALADLTAALVMGKPAPARLVEHGLDPGSVSPARFKN